MSFTYKKDLQNRYRVTWEKCVEYKNVYKLVNKNKDYNYAYRVMVHFNNYTAEGFETARDAALALDKKLLEIGQKPRNILKFKQKRKKS